MLVLSRKIGQRIVLPETGVSIIVLGVHGKRARLGIEAPPGSPVHREEVWRRILAPAEPIRGAGLAEKVGCPNSAS